VSLSKAVRDERNRRKREAFQKRERDILIAAEQLMAAQGVRQVTVDAIAARTGIGKGTIYKHFDTKHEVFVALAVRYFDHLTLVLNQAVDPQHQLMDWVEAQLAEPQRAELIDELIDVVDDLASAIAAIREARRRMRRRMAQILGSTGSVKGALATERAIWLEHVVRGALIEIRSPLRREDFDGDRLIESVNRLIPLLFAGAKKEPADERLTYL
jgi:AcrR family transcriptional regulator